MSDRPKCPGCDVVMTVVRSAAQNLLLCEKIGCELQGRCLSYRLLAKLAPQPVGDGVEVRAAVVCGVRESDGWMVLGMSDLDDERTLGEAARYYTNKPTHVAWLTARVPLPQVPTVAAKVEGVSQ